MVRRSITDRYDELDKLGAKLAGVGQPPSPIHVATANVLSDLMSMGAKLSSKETPAHLRAFMRTLDRMRPMMLEGVSDVPADKIVEFMTDLRAQLDTIIHAGTEGREDGTGADRSVADRASA